MAGSAILLSCPRCKRDTDSLKQYRMVQLFIFVVVAGSARGATYTACPGCMRRIILERFAINLLPANLTMFIIGPMFFVQLLRTFTRGHSHAIEKEIREKLAAAERQEANRPKAERNARLLLGELGPIMVLVEGGEYARALDSLRAASARLEQIGDWEAGLAVFVRKLEIWNFAGARDWIPVLPADLQRPFAAILETFARRRPEDALDDLIRGLEHPDKDVRLTSAIALGHIGGRAAAAAPALRKALADSDRTVSAMAKDALQQMGAK